MKDSTLKLIFAGGLTLLGLVAAFGVVITGMLQERDVQEIIAVAAIFSNLMVMGAAFFFGHQNGQRSRNGG